MIVWKINLNFALMEEINKISKELCKLLSDTAAKFLHEKGLHQVDWLTFGMDGLGMTIEHGIPCGGCDISLSLYDDSDRLISQVI